VNYVAMTLGRQFLGLGEGEDITAAVVDEARNKIYFSVDTNSGGARIFNFDIATQNITQPRAPNQLDYNQNNNEAFMRTAVVDPANNMAYFGTANVPGRVVRINLNPFGKGSTTQLADTAANLDRAIFDPIRRKIYFTMLNGVVIVNLTDPAIPVWDSDMALDISGAAYLRSIVYDAVGGALYTGTFTDEPGAPSKVVKWNLSPLSLDTGSCEFPSTESGGLQSVMYDASRRMAYFGVYRDPAKLAPWALPGPCKEGCNGRGNCNFGVCECTGTLNGVVWSGPSCTDLLCPMSTDFRTCQNGGACQNGTCACSGNFRGTGCENKICPGDCSLQGSCDTSTYTCKCNKGYRGDDCGIAIPAIPPCPELLTCAACYANRACGWCQDSSTCMYGDAVGPILVANTTFKQCRRWDQDSCSDDGLTALAWIFAVIAFIMLAIDMCSAVQEDYDDTSKVFRRSGWRACRSAHTWFMIARMQLLVLIGMFNFKFPTLYHNFLAGLRWSWAGFEGPFTNATELAMPVRRLAGFDQYATYTGNSVRTEFPSAFLYYAAIGVGYLVIMVIVWIVGSLAGIWSEGFHDKRPAPLPGRIIYTLVRLSQFAYLPLVTLGASSFVLNPEDGGFSFLAVLTVAILGIGFPLGLLILIFLGSREEAANLQKAKDSKGKVPNKLVFMSRLYRQRWGAFYLTYRPKGGDKSSRLWWGAIYLVRLFIFGLVVGFGASSADSGVAQGIVIIVVEGLYFGGLIAGRPHAFIALRDIELVSCLANIISVGIAIAIKDMTDPVMRSNMGIGIIVPQLIMMLVDVIGFIKAWLSMEDIFSLDQCVKKMKGSSGDA
jgi:hypothetical protein